MIKQERQSNTNPSLSNKESCVTACSHTLEIKDQPKCNKVPINKAFNTLNQFQCLTRYQQHVVNNMLWEVEDTTNKWIRAIIYTLDQKYILYTKYIYLYKDFFSFIFMTIKHFILNLYKTNIILIRICNGNVFLKVI